MKSNLEKKKTQRRDFLKQFFWGGALLCANPLSLYASGKPQTNKENILLPDEAKRQEALTFFYKKEYKNAESLFKELVTSFPAKVEYYDGLRKVFGAQNKLSDICRLYANGLENNRNNPLFYDRYARALSSLSGGNRKERLQYEQEINASLINLSIQLYLDAISRFPDKKYLKIGLLDIRKKAETFASPSSRTPLKSDIALLSKITAATSGIKEEWSKSRISIKKNSPENRAFYIRKPLDTTPKIRRRMYFPEEEQLRSKQIAAHRQWVVSIKTLNLFRTSVYTTIYNYVVALSPQVMTDVLFGKIKKYAKRSRQQNLLIELTQNRYTQLKSFWRTISYADSLKSNNSTASKALSLYVEAEKKNKTLQPKKIGALYGGMATCLVQQGNYTKARERLLQGIGLLNGIGGVARGLSIHYAKTFIRESNYDQAENILLLLLRSCKNENAELPETFNDPIVKYIAPDPLIDQELSFYRRLGGGQKMSDGEILAVYYALAHLYIQKKDTAAYSGVKNEILKLSPENRFIQKNHL